MLERGQTYWSEYWHSDVLWRYRLHLGNGSIDTLCLWPGMSGCFMYTLQTGELKELDVEYNRCDPGQPRVDIPYAELLDYVSPYINIDALKERITSLQFGQSLENGKVYTIESGIMLHKGEQEDAVYMRLSNQYDTYYLVYKLQTGGYKEVTGEQWYKRYPPPQEESELAQKYVERFISLDTLKAKLEAKLEDKRK